jgi:NAD(P)-dependent dehydrogenase (short-subunit alcohol dehydrogenase family)
VTSGAEQATAGAVGGPVQGDETREGDVEAMIQTAIDESAGSTRCSTWPVVAESAMLADVAVEHFDRQMNIDLRGVMLGMEHGIRAMLANEDGGSIVNRSSVGGLNGSTSTRVYEVAAFLASDRAPLPSGAVIAVDGGWAATVA